MSAALQLIAGLGLVVGVAAAILWLVEAVAKRFGSKNTWLLFVVVMPLAISLAITLLNWEGLVWWERLAYTFSGPLVAVALLFVGFAVFNPADALLLLCTLIGSGWRSLMQTIRGRHRDA